MTAILQTLLLLPLCLAALASVVRAEPLSDKDASSAQLAELLDQKSIFANSLRFCQDPAGTQFDPKVVFKSNNTAFGGISPSSAYWPRIEAMYRGYQGRFCSELHSDKVAKQFANSLAQQLSVEDLRASIAFYSTPAGKHLSQAHVGAYEGNQRWALEAIESFYPKEAEVLAKEFANVLQQYQANPR